MAPVPNKPRFSRRGYILVTITVDIWQLQDQTVFGKRAKFDVNIRTRASVLEGEGGLCGGVPEMYVPSLLH